MTGPTPRQAQVLAYIRDHLAQRGYSPSIREIASHLGVRSTYTVTGHLQALVKKGLLRTGGHGMQRTWRPVESDEQALARFSDEVLQAELARRAAARSAA